MQIPDIQKYIDCQNYVSDLYSLNRKNGGVGSFRFYAKKLNWPISYLNEVIKGSKKLSIKRAIELGQFLDLDSVDLERLIYLSMKDTESQTIRDYINRKLQNEHKFEERFQVSKNTDFTDDWLEAVPEDIFKDISLLAIFDVISWKRGHITPFGIANILYSFPDLKNIEILSEKLSILKQYGYISYQDPISSVTEFDVIKKKLFFSVSKENAIHMGQYADNYKRFLSAANQRGWIASGFVTIPRARLNAVKKRIINLRNWLLQIDNEDFFSQEDSTEDSLIFQLDLNLFSILDCEQMKIDNLNKWANEKNGH